MGRIASKSAIDIKSPLPLLSDINRTLAVSINKTEDGLLERVHAENEREVIIRALVALSWSLAMTYCEPEKDSVYEISLDMRYREIAIKKYRSVALMEFTEAYKHGKLLVRK